MTIINNHVVIKLNEQEKNRLRVYMTLLEETMPSRAIKELAFGRGDKMRKNARSHRAPIPPK